MSYEPQGGMFVEGTQLGIDANANTVTQSLDMRNARDVVFQVIANSGTHATHVVTLQVSMDDTNWFTTSFSLTGVGITSTSFLNLAKFARLKVTTVEGAVASVQGIKAMHAKELSVCSLQKYHEKIHAAKVQSI